MSTSPIKVFITGAANGLAEVREGLADHHDVELVGTAADPAKAGAKLAESSAQVILHGTTATDHVPTGEIEAIRGVTPHRSSWSRRRAPTPSSPRPWLPASSTSCCCRS